LVTAEVNQIYKQIVIAYIASDVEFNHVTACHAFSSLPLGIGPAANVKKPVSIDIAWHWLVEKNLGSNKSCRDLNTRFIPAFMYGAAHLSPVISVSLSYRSAK
jgi:hypothetical protein